MEKVFAKNKNKTKQNKTKNKKSDKSENPQSNEETLELTLLQDKVSSGSHQAWWTTQLLVQYPDFSYSPPSGWQFCKYSAIQGSKEKCQTVKTADTTKDVSHFQGRQCPSFQGRELSYKIDSAHGTYDCQLDNNFSEFSAYLLSWTSNSAMKALVIALLYFEYTIAPFPGIFCSLEQTICYVESASVTPYPVKVITLSISKNLPWALYNP